jgi:hypothetical protein
MAEGPQWLAIVGDGAAQLALDGTFRLIQLRLLT